MMCRWAEISMVMVVVGFASASASAFGFGFDVEAIEYSRQNSLCQDTFYLL